MPPSRLPYSFFHLPLRPPFFRYSTPPPAHTQTHSSTAPALHRFCKSLRARPPGELRTRAAASQLAGRLEGEPAKHLTVCAD